MLQLITCNSTEIDDEYPLLLELSGKDPLFDKKKVRSSKRTVIQLMLTDISY